MIILPVIIFKNDLSPFTNLLTEGGIAYRLRQLPVGRAMGSGHTLELVQSVNNAAFWASLATVIVALINKRRGSKVIISTKNGAVINAEGLSPSEIEQVLRVASSLTIIDPKTIETKDS